MYRIILNINIETHKLVEDIEINTKINKLIVKEVVNYYFNKELDTFNINNNTIEYTNTFNNCMDLLNKIKEINLFTLIGLNKIITDTSTPNNTDTEEEIEPEEPEEPADIIEYINKIEDNYINIKEYLKTNKPVLCKDYLKEGGNYTINSYYLRKGGNSIRCCFTLLQYPNIVFKDNNTIKNILKEKTNNYNYCKTLKTKIRINCYNATDKDLEFIEIY